MTAAVQLDEPELEPLGGTLEQLVKVANERRPDLQRLQAVSDSHQFASHSARAAARPQVAARELRVDRPDPAGD